MKPIEMSVLQNPILHNINYSTFLIRDYPVDDS